MVLASQVSPVSPGDTLAGRYRVERVIGIGGMGVVVAARHLELDHLVAIKFLLPKVAENRDIVGRFTREARAAVKIQNEHVARVTDVGTLETGAPYMVMEYLDGADLEDYARQHGPLSIEEATDFVLQACEAIAEAHGLGIVHRDLKPGNLFLVRRPDGSRIVKVLDFGISKVTGPGNNAVAPTTAMLGSPPYMSPEQLTTPREVDLRTDIWALGVILYRLLTGRVPFDADTIVQLCTVILHGDPPPLREARADVPAGLEAIILKCLAKDRTRRYANVGELAKALLEYAPDRSRVSVERVLHLTTTQPATADTVLGKRPRQSSAPELAPFAPAIETNSGWGQTARGPKQRSRRGTWLIASAALVGLAALGAWRFDWLQHHDRSASIAPAPAPPIPSPLATPERPRAEAPVDPIGATHGTASPATSVPSSPVSSAPPASSEITRAPSSPLVGSPPPALTPKPLPRRPLAPSPAAPKNPEQRGWEDQRK
jgi:serine/threonine-protein kinase